MIARPYHHGDLRNALIEAGIDLINEKGISQFSLRKVAAMCSVSHTAPYSHFKDIDALIQAMSEHVTAQFMETLQTAIKGLEGHSDVTTILGKAYISFFTEHPNYFQFLFYHSGIMINLDDDNANDYPPFTLFRDTAYQTFRKFGLPLAAQKQLLITMWALVHGIAALLTNKKIKYSGDWEKIMDNNTLRRQLHEYKTTSF